MLSMSAAPPGRACPSTIYVSPKSPSLRGEMRHDAWGPPESTLQTTAGCVCAGFTDVLTMPVATSKIVRRKSNEKLHTWRYSLCTV